MLTWQFLVLFSAILVLNSKTPVSAYDADTSASSSHLGRDNVKGRVSAALTHAYDDISDTSASSAVSTLSTRLERDKGDKGRNLAALNGVCTSNADCTSTTLNSVCSTQNLCKCAGGYYFVSGVCLIVPAGFYPTASITYSSSNRYWDDIAVSADFMKLVACNRGYYFRLSTDGGLSWIDLTGSGQRPWETITANDDLSKIAAATDGNSGRIWLSIDGGT